ncbi:bifunctional adenosylcobinamide kinase/adenosylcobinamide-phosphate guanylyltransferase [Faecalicatena faecalis]
MFHLVTGGSGSGKSAFAEGVVCQFARECAGDLFYIATMMPFGEETERKIKRHRRMRADKGFQTIECYTELEQMAEQGSGDCPSWGNAFHPCVLLECMSNLTANEIYQSESSRKDAAERIIRGVAALRRKCSHLVIVTNEVCSECTQDSEEMQLYKRVLAEINVRLAQMADAVTEVVYGIPVVWKAPSSDDQGCAVSSEKTGNSIQIEAAFQSAANQTAVNQTATNQAAANQSAITGNRKGVPGMKLVIGGAHQGKWEYAKRKYGGIEPAEFHWVDGKSCSFEEVYSCGGIYHFELLMKRMMKAGEDTSHLASRIAEKNPDIVIVSTEIGYGLVPIDAFDREYREQTGRVCTQLAELSSRVDRVVCGIGVTLKGE